MKSRVLSLCLALAACGDTTSTGTDQLNLDRPVDVAFACAGGLRITGGGGDDSATPETPVELLQAQPLISCELHSRRTPITGNSMTDNKPIPPPGQQDLTAQGGAQIPRPRWYALVLQRGPGTVAIAEFDTKPARQFTGETNDVDVRDADPHTPGKNSISIGEDPIGIITDNLGCTAITANAGSCDLSAMDLTTAFDGGATLDGEYNIIRFPVTNGLGQPIRSKPAAIVADPQDTLIGNYCPSQLPGAPSPVLPQGLAYIAYPSCHLVAGVDLATGRMVSGIQFSAAGVPSIVTDLNAISCPDECGETGTIAAGPHPVTLDLEEDDRFATRRLVIGSNNTNAITVVELDATSAPLSVSQVVLEDPAGDLGVTQLALSKVIGMGGNNGIDDTSGRADYQFVYAVATDQTVRVAEVQSLNRECDTQVDPRLVRGQDVPALGCFPVGGASTPRRRPGARGPGIFLGVDQIPLGVDFFRSPESVLSKDDTEGAMGESQFVSIGGAARLIGSFAVISSTTGDSFVVNIDDDDYPDLFTSGTPLAPPIANLLSHQLRDAVPFRDQTAFKGQTSQLRCEWPGPVLSNGALVGGPRATSMPSRNLQGFIAPEKALQLPGARQLLCDGIDEDDDPVQRLISELSFQQDDIARDQAFPDLRMLASDEQLSIVWEGSLSQDRSDTATDGPVVRESMLYVDQAGMHLRDQTRPYCDAGVEPFDIVQMRGCDPSLASTDCPINYTCYVHPQSQVQGLGACMRSDEAERLAEACKDFLTSVRRYTVVQASSGELLLTTRRHELRTTPLDGCTSDEQCETLGDLARRSSLSTHPSDPVEQATVDDRTWVCRTDATRPPRGVNNKRCNMSCDTTAHCASGTVCVGGNEATPERDGLCMEGVVPPQSCVNAPQRYELRAGETFVFVGARTGYVHPIETDASGVCKKPVDANPYATSRIPLTPPPCEPDADPVSGLRPNGEYEPNPCSYTASHGENLPIYQPGTCTLADPSSEFRERQAPAIRYRSRGMTFSIVDPYYPGDQACITDRLGPNGMPLDRIPQVFHGYSMNFRVQPGFIPLTLANARTTMPVKVVRGPLNSMWVVDEGDFLSPSLGVPSTRGKVFRVEHTNTNATNVLQ